MTLMHHRPGGDASANNQGNVDDIVVCEFIDDDNEDAGDEATTDGTLTAPSPSCCAVNTTTPEAAWREVDEERELMLIEAAELIKMSRAQRALYQAKVALAIQDATANKDHCDTECTPSLLIMDRIWSCHLIKWSSQVALIITVR